MRRIGIYAGTFDPVHTGHVAFALQAMEKAKLDKLYFLPERRPRHKKGVEHFGHRVAMLQRAVKPHPKFAVLELDDVSFSIERTLPRLKREFLSDQLVFLFGSDAIQHLGNWPLAERLLASSELVIGLRSQDDRLQRADAKTSGQELCHRHLAQSVRRMEPLHESTGVAKIVLSITKRMGRGLIAINTSASTNET